MKNSKEYDQGTNEGVKMGEKQKKWSIDMFHGIHAVKGKAECISISGLFGMKIPSGYTYCMDPDIIGENYAARIQKSSDVCMEIAYGFTNFTLNILDLYYDYNILSVQGNMGVVHIANMDDVVYRTDNIKVGLTSSDENVKDQLFHYVFEVRILDRNAIVRGIMQFVSSRSCKKKALDILKWVFDLSVIADNYEEYPVFYKENLLNYSMNLFADFKGLNVGIPDGFTLMDEKGIMIPDTAAEVDNFKKGLLTKHYIRFLSAVTLAKEMPDFSDSTMCGMADILRKPKVNVRKETSSDSENTSFFNNERAIILTERNDDYACLEQQEIYVDGDRICSLSKVAVIEKKRITLFALLCGADEKDLSNDAAVKTDAYRLVKNWLRRINAVKRNCYSSVEINNEFFNESEISKVTAKVGELNDLIEQKEKQQLTENERKELEAAKIQLAGFREQLSRETESVRGYNEYPKQQEARKKAEHEKADAQKLADKAMEQIRTKYPYTDKNSVHSVSDIVAKEKSADTVGGNQKSEHEWRYPTADEIRKSDEEKRQRTERLNSKWHGSYVENMFAILDVERELTMLGRPMQEFCVYYKDSFPSLTNDQIGQLREDCKSKVTDRDFRKKYTESFEKRSVKEKYAITTMHAYVIREDLIDPDRANWAIDITKQWYSPDEMVTIRELFKDQLQPPKKEGCYIATAVYGSYDSPEVMVLRKFRDEVLQKSFAGRLFTRIYYLLSPPIAGKLKNAECINKIVRKLLDKWVNHLNATR